jgi:hypothetical protein
VVCGPPTSGLLVGTFAIIRSSATARSSLLSRDAMPAAATASRRQPGPCLLVVTGRPTKAQWRRHGPSVRTHSGVPGHRG